MIKEPLKTSRIEMANSPSQIIYDDDDDLIVYFFMPDEEAIVRYLDNHLAAIYDPATLEVIGFQIEGVDGFLGKYL